MKRIQRILHATDLSTASRRAFAKAVELAIQERAELLLQHVMALPASFVASEPPADYLAFLSQARRETARRSLPCSQEPRRAASASRPSSWKGSLPNRSFAWQDGGTRT
jgi:nucleotide-binding universal stress UspA family protein